MCKVYRARDLRLGRVVGIKGLPEAFAMIMEAWRDGYAEPIGEFTRFSRAEATAHFDQMIADIRNPRRYAVWMVPVVSARVPTAG